MKADYSISPAVIQTRAIITVVSSVVLSTAQAGGMSCLANPNNGTSGTKQSKMIFSGHGEAIVINAWPVSTETMMITRNHCSRSALVSCHCQKPVWWSGRQNVISCGFINFTCTPRHPQYLGLGEGTSWRSQAACQRRSTCLPSVLVCEEDPSMWADRCLALQESALASRAWGCSLLWDRTMGNYNHARQVFCRFSFFSLHCTVALVKSLRDSTP